MKNYNTCLEIMYQWTVTIWKVLEPSDYNVFFLIIGLFLFKSLADNVKTVICCNYKICLNLKLISQVGTKPKNKTIHDLCIESHRSRPRDFVRNDIQADKVRSYLITCCPLAGG